MGVAGICLQLSLQRGLQPGKAVHEHEMSSLVRQNPDVPLSQGAHSESKYRPAAPDASTLHYLHQRQVWLEDSALEFPNWRQHTMVVNGGVYLQCFAPKKGDLSL